MKRALAVALVLVAVVPPALAKQKDEAEEEDSGDEEEGSDEADEDAAPKDKAKEAVKEEDAEDDTDAGLRPKQDLSGHDLGTNKRDNEFERDRFFVDKVDTEKTEDATLIQGSIASSTFLYKESAGAYPNLMVGDAQGPTRLFTEMRLQTDFRHIKASRWEARVDARARVVPQPANNSSITPENNIQSGLTGDNEYELRELWLVRAGKRSDFFLGRQFVPDMGGVKLDGIRIDYAKSAKLTFIGFGGLYPVRGSRSLTTDYKPLEDEGGQAAGRFVTTGGFGGAYRTINAYGALGGVAMYPLSKETPRFYVTSTGYLRSGSKLDLYHFALVDLLGTAASRSSTKFQITNLSAGANFKPNPRLRLTGNFNRVDTETLNVQAGAFLGDVDRTTTGNTVVQNEAFIARLATNSVRGGVSAGLGKQQRFEISTAVSFRYRPEFDLKLPDGTVAATAKAAKSVEVWGGVVDRHFIKNTRIGIDGSQTFSVGDVAYQRSVLFLGRLFVNREIGGGRGEWEAEGSYSKVKDTTGAMTLACTSPADCYGSSNNTVISLGGQLFYRIKTDWFGIGTLHVMQISNKRSDQLVDPKVLGITGFVRIAKRF
ncbi:MAG TPA: hypothetical protein VIV40_05875 [Kofleriaceae bacterium]